MIVMPRMKLALMPVFALLLSAVCFAEDKIRVACVGEPVKVILDTDMVGDYDDMGALACLHAEELSWMVQACGQR